MNLYLIILTFYLIQISTTQEQTGTISISNNSYAQVETQSESEIKLTSTHPTSARLRTDENYKTLSNKSSVDIDILNDSSEVDDFSDTGQKTVGLGFDDFVSPKMLSKQSALPPSQFNELKLIKNVFKVPKTRNKKTLPQSLSSLYGDPAMFDRLSNGYSNLTRYQNYFHAFSSLFDHFLWNVSSYSTTLNNLCTEDVNIYLNDLKLHVNWALKASDASGKYRGLFFFDNDYWLGKLKMNLINQ